MLRSLTASDVANQISMCRSSFKGAYVIVEGNTDIRLYRKFLAEGGEIISANSRSNVTRAVEECRRRKDPKVIGIVDRDMDDLIGRSVKAPVFATDGRDMESMLIRSPALDAVLAEYADPERLAKFEGSFSDIRTAIRDAASPIGALMLLSYRKGMGLSFKDLDHSMFVSRSNLHTNVLKMVDEVLSLSTMRAYSRDSLVAMVKDAVASTSDGWQLTRGHDAVSVLVIALRNIIGSYNARSVGSNSLSGSLRIAYGMDLFSETSLYRESAAYAEKTGFILWTDCKNATG